MTCYVNRYMIMPNIVISMMQSYTLINLAYCINFSPSAIILKILLLHYNNSLIGFNNYFISLHCTFNLKSMSFFNKIFGGGKK